MSPASLTDARRAVELAHKVVEGATARLVELGGVDANQTLAYELAHAAAATAIATSALAYGELGDLESRLACVFVADVICDLAAKTLGREPLFGVEADWIAPVRAFLEAGRALAVAEPGTVTWYAFKISDTEYGIFDSFETKEARQAHLDGEIPTALGQVAPDLLAKDPDIRTVDVIAVK